MASAIPLAAAPTVAPAAGGVGDREFVVAGVRLSHFPSNDRRANTTLLVKSLVKKHKATDDGPLSVPSSFLLQASEWAQTILLHNVEWLVKLAKRTATGDESTPVVLSTGNGHEIMVLWTTSERPSTTASSTVALSSRFAVRYVNIALTLCSEDAGSAMDGLTLVQTNGCIQPSDCLYEHVRCEAEFGAPGSRPTIYLSTEHVPWAGSFAFASVSSPPGHHRTQQDALSHPNKRHVLLVQTSPQDPFTPVRVVAMGNPESYFARIVGHGPTPLPISATAQGMQRQGVASLPAPHSDNDEEEEGASHATTGVTGFYPRELLMLARAFRDEPFSEQEEYWDTTEVTPIDLQRCERLLYRNHDNSQASSAPTTSGRKLSNATTTEERKVSAPPASPEPGDAGHKATAASAPRATAEAAATGPTTPALKQPPGPTDKVPAPSGKKRGRPVGSKNKPKGGRGALSTNPSEGPAKVAALPVSPKPGDARQGATAASAPKPRTEIAATGPTTPGLKQPPAPTERAPAPSGKKRGRPAGSKNKPKDGKDSATTKASNGEPRAKKGTEKSTEAVLKPGEASTEASAGEIPPNRAAPAAKTGKVQVSESEGGSKQVATKATGGKVPDTPQRKGTTSKVQKTQSKQDEPAGKTRKRRRTKEAKDAPKDGKKKKSNDPS